MLIPSYEVEHYHSSCFFLKGVVYPSLTRLGARATTKRTLQVGWSVSVKPKTTTTWDHLYPGSWLTAARTSSRVAISHSTDLFVKVPQIQTIGHVLAMHAP